MLSDPRSKQEQILAKLENDTRDEIHSILGMLSLIARGSLTRSQSNFLRACKLSADRLLRSVQDVSLLLNQELEPHQSSVFDLYETIHNLVGLMEALTARKKLTLSCDIDHAVPKFVTGDRERLQDILGRILDNAVRFTDQGGVRLIVQPKRDFGECCVQFEISDTGPGIPADIVENVSRPPAKQVFGRGLGLAIVKKLAQSMGGDLEIQSQPGASRVTVFVSLEVAAADLSYVNEGSRSTARLNILVAEDSDDSYYVLEGFLEQQHRLTRARNGSQAVELFKTGKYDLVFMDIHMPDMDGYTAARAIRVWETGRARARVPIIVLSSDSPATQLQNGAKAGCSAYLTKPVSGDVLQCVLQRYTTTVRM